VTFRDRLSKTARFFRYLTIGFCTAPIVGSWLYINGYRLSGIFCPVRHWTGIICPSCGMTRSFMAIASGDLRSAIDYHLFGPLLFIGFGLVVVHSSWELFAGVRMRAFYLNWLQRTDLRLTLLCGFFGYYLLRLQSIIPTHHL
jgi:Protein of unknown function (DUF2752)